MDNVVPNTPEEITWPPLYKGGIAGQAPDGIYIAEILIRKGNSLCKSHQKETIMPNEERDAL